MLPSNTMSCNQMSSSLLHCGSPRSNSIEVKTRALRTNGGLCAIGRHVRHLLGGHGYSRTRRKLTVTHAQYDVIEQPDRQRSEVTLSNDSTVHTRAARSSVSFAPQCLVAKRPAAMNATAHSQHIHAAKVPPSNPSVQMGTSCPSTVPLPAAPIRLARPRPLPTPSSVPQDPAAATSVFMVTVRLSPRLVGGVATAVDRPYGVRRAPGR